MGRVRRRSVGFENTRTAGAGFAVTCFVWQTPYTAGDTLVSCARPIVQPDRALHSREDSLLRAHVRQPGIIGL